MTDHQILIHQILYTMPTGSTHSASVALRMALYKFDYYYYYYYYYKTHMPAAYIGLLIYHYTSTVYSYYY